MEITWRVISRKGERGEWRKGLGNKWHKWQVENKQGDGMGQYNIVQYSKYRSQRTYMYDPWTRTKDGSEECEWEGECRVEGNKGGKWDNQ